MWWFARAAYLFECIAVRNRQRRIQATRLFVMYCITACVCMSMCVCVFFWLYAWSVYTCMCAFYVNEYALTIFFPWMLDIFHSARLSCTPYNRRIEVFTNEILIQHLLGNSNCQKTMNSDKFLQALTNSDKFLAPKWQWLWGCIPRTDACQCGHFNGAVKDRPNSSWLRMCRLIRISEHALFNHRISTERCCEPYSTHAHTHSHMHILLSRTQTHHPTANQRVIQTRARRESRENQSTRYIWYLRFCNSK